MKKVESDIITIYRIMAIVKPRSATAVVLSYRHNNNNIPGVLYNLYGFRFSVRNI